MPVREILIYSEPVHSGKSTRLMNWCARQEKIQGFVSPDVDYRRKLYDLSEQKLYEFEVTESDDRPAVIIGHYQFLLDTFHRAHAILKDMEKNCQEADASYFWMIDEIGKLELKGNGFEPAFSSFLETFKLNGKGTLVLVVRDYLLEEVIAHYHLSSAKVIRHAWFE